MFKTILTVLTYLRVNGLIQDLMYPVQYLEYRFCRWQRTRNNICGKKCGKKTKSEKKNKSFGFKDMYTGKKCLSFSWLFKFTFSVFHWGLYDLHRLFLINCFETVCRKTVIDRAYCVNSHGTPCVCYASRSTFCSNNTLLEHIVLNVK